MLKEHAAQALNAIKEDLSKYSLEHDLLMKDKQERMYQESSFHSEYASTVKDRNKCKGIMRRLTLEQTDGDQPQILDYITLKHETMVWSSVVTIGCAVHGAWAASQGDECVSVCVDPLTGLLASNAMIPIGRGQREVLRGHVVCRNWTAKRATSYASARSWRWMRQGRPGFSKQ